MLHHSCLLVWLLLALSPADIVGQGSQVLPATPWTYDSAGDDWVGQDGSGTPWVCTTGKQQSPINIVTSSSVTKALTTEQRVTFDLGAVKSNGSNVIITNNGHSVQVTWDQPGFKPGITITVKDGQPLTSHVELGAGESSVHQVVAVPRQFHFHAHSEHLVQGHLFPLEAHLVSVVSQDTLPACPPDGCVVVTGVQFELSDDLSTGSTWLEPLFSAMPLSEGDTAYLGAGARLDLQQLLPANQSYASYAGSLTTPPCNEGVLWIMLLNPQKLSLKQWRRFMEAVGDYNCTLQASNTQPASNTTSSTKGGRKLQQQHMHSRWLQAQQGSSTARALQQAASAESQYSCKKMGAGENYRVPQPLNGRVLRVWSDGSKKAGYLPEDAASAASAGAVAGIVLGATLGAGLTAVIGWVAYKEYQKRRLKRFYKYGVSSGDMLSVQREVETQWLNVKTSNAGAGAL